MHGWRNTPDMLNMSDAAYEGYHLAQTAWMTATGISMGLALVCAIIALRKRTEIDVGTKQVKLHWTLLVVPPVCTMLFGALIWI